MKPAAASAVSAASAAIGALLALAACAASLGDAMPGRAVERSPGEWTLRLPAAPADVLPDGAVLRITITPPATPDSRSPAPVTVHASLYPADRPQQRTRLGSWSLYPPDSVATFVARVPAGVVEAGRRPSGPGAGLVLQVDSPGVALASVQARWAGPPAR